MDLYHALGPLILGSRLRRMSEYFIAEVNKAYLDQGIDFDASWFPFFYLLSEKRPVSIRDISDRLQVSHSAVSQLVRNLKNRHLVETEVDVDDARRQVVSLSTGGQELLQRIIPIWDAISTVFTQLQLQHGEIAPLLSSITAIERLFAEKALSTRITESLTTYAR